MGRAERRAHASNVVTVFNYALEAKLVFLHLNHPLVEAINPRSAEKE